MKMFNKLCFNVMKLWNLNTRIVKTVFSDIWVICFSLLIISFYLILGIDLHNILSYISGNIAFYNLLTS